MKNQMQISQQRVSQQDEDSSHYQASLLLSSQLKQKQLQISMLQSTMSNHLKQITSAKTSIYQLQLENNNLKTIIKSLTTLKNADAKLNLQHQLSLLSCGEFGNMNKEVQKCKNVRKTSEEKQLLKQISGNQTAFNEQENRMQHQIKLKDKNVKQLKNSVERLKTLSKENKGYKDLEKAIEKCKKIPTYVTLQQIQHLHSKINERESKLTSANQKISQMKQKMKNYENQIKQLQQIIQDKKAIIQQMQWERKQKRKSKSKPKEIKKFYGCQKYVEQEMKYNKINFTTSALILTKSYYTSPFMELQDRNSIRIFKTDKNGKVDKSLGSLKYRVNTISYDSDQTITNTISSICSNFSKRINSRVVIYGVSKFSNKVLMCNIVKNLKDKLLKQMDRNDQQHGGVIYVQFQDGFMKSKQIIGVGKLQAQQIFQDVSYIDQQQQKITKKFDKIQGKQKLNQIRFFKFYYQNLFIELISTSFLWADIKEQMSLSKALDTIAYSKIPNFDHNAKCNTQIILTLNPIVGLYEECKLTLTLANCKGKQLEKINDYEKKSNHQSPPMTFGSRASSPPPQHNIRVIAADEDVFQNQNMLPFKQIKLNKQLNKIYSFS